MTDFPFDMPAKNAASVHPRILRAVSQLLGIRRKPKARDRKLLSARRLRRRRLLRQQLRLWRQLRLRLRLWRLR